MVHGNRRNSHSLRTSGYTIIKSNPDMHTDEKKINPNGQVLVTDEGRALVESLRRPSQGGPTCKPVRVPVHTAALDLWKCIHVDHSLGTTLQDYDFVAPKGQAKHQQTASDDPRKSHLLTSSRIGTPESVNPECGRAHSVGSRRNTLASQTNSICKPDRVPVYTAALRGLTDGPDHGVPAQQDMGKRSRRFSIASQSTTASSAASTEKDCFECSPATSLTCQHETDILDTIMSLGDPGAPDFLVHMGGRDW